MLGLSGSKRTDRSGWIPGAGPELERDPAWTQVLGPPLEHPYLLGGHLMRKRPADATGPRPDTSPACHCRRMGRASRRGGPRCQCEPGHAGRRVPADRAGRRPGRRPLVDLALQRRGLARAQRPRHRRGQHPHRDAGRRRHDHYNPSNRLPVMDGWDYIVRLLPNPPP